METRLEASLKGIGLPPASRFKTATGFGRRLSINGRLISLIHGYPQKC
jgi:hypothetical protein